ncbi:MFS transporter [Opitutaceae bacterium TAV4]|nr:MFS transporter [Opitutaceae bacterium TAV4]RRJ98835.1 MFS transporter [Opitutaceae bacterium TAV3]RRJ99011.1 MFS transporter [Opitutaceae bacterium TAV3]
MTTKQAHGTTAAEGTVLSVLIALSVSHMLNDTVQAIVPAIYPLLKDTFQLSFTQIGLITLVNQLTASILQPVVGSYTDKHPKPYSLAIGMTLTLIGLVMLGLAHGFPMLLAAAALVGTGSSIFHPEASRMARMASGGKFGLAQSIFQVGGNFGSSLGPLLAAAVIIPRGLPHTLWFTLLALVAIIVLARVGNWYKARLLQTAHARAASPSRDSCNKNSTTALRLPKRTVILALTILSALIFSKYIYLVSLTNYYTFYLIDKFGISLQAAQICLFVFLFAVAAGTIVGGPVGDRIGRKSVIWTSILGVAPFTLALPHLPLTWVVVFSVMIGFILASAFSAILVYAQELIPGRVGLVAGVFFGFAFGIAGIGSAALGTLADHTSIGFVFNVCAFLPLIGLVTGFLPEVEKRPKRPR